MASPAAGTALDRNALKKKLSKRLALLEFYKERVDIDLKKIKMKATELTNQFKHYVDSRDYQFEALYVRRLKARKIVAVSVGLSLSSLAVGIQSKLGLLSRDLLPWTIAVGVGSFACSIFFLKDVYLSFLNQKRHLRLTRYILELEEKAHSPRSLPEEVLITCCSGKTFTKLDRRRLSTQ